MAVTAGEAGIEEVRSVEDFDALRRHWATLPTEVVFSHREAAPLIEGRGTIYVHMRGEQTAGDLGFYEQIVPAGAVVGAHHQTHEDEGFYVLDGRWEFRAGSDVREVGPGTVIFAPPGCAHAFRPLDGPGRLITWNAPAGHERFYVGMGASHARGENPRSQAAPKYRTVFEGA